MILFLLGCGLTGDWSGSIDCGGGSDIDIEATVEPDGSNEWAGEMEWASSDNVDGRDVVARFTFDVVLEMDGSFGEQEVEMSGELTDCFMSTDGEDVSDQINCNEGWEIDNGDDEWTWDGANTIDVEGDDCNGEVERD